ncbi:hypothetical protein XU18_0737 [Perkinsela sp. CCAP 1560/4]|nr:hypothetical protein XU18_0737 [Perkinsela sp. CCAP 1560/4]|eukprot:KNH08882.1 hypothetical protein XU18_0737 [Perkinsela sp. CCAP 1560/4]
MNASKEVKDCKTHRKDYLPLPVSVPEVSLSFFLDDETVIVESKMRLKLQRKTDSFMQAHNAEPLEVLSKNGIQLHGSSYLNLKSLSLNQKQIAVEDYCVLNGVLQIKPSLFTIEPSSTSDWNLQITVEIRPQDNLTLSGLYKSCGNFVTQCESEGFRNITYAFDRPDVMSVYTTKIFGNKTSLPVILGNGNLIASGDVEGKPGYHFAEWHDPFPKPTYLFAIVAGKLLKLRDTFTTKSGKKVDLDFYCEEKYVDKLDHAIASLKKAMKWDEEVYGLEYDLNLFNIVAIDDFNAGAMENKSLNIFNSSLIVAGKRTATDSDLERIEGVVAHEYFHNWTGNRVTCRDWFQLTLKEGLTVYRDQEFSSDMNSRAVVRLQNVAFLQSRQFPEDQSSMRHPIRPDEYEAIDNFYTYTVYEKGAEVVRMYESMYGKKGFRKGLDLYFHRHDGCAVTCEDFLQAMADANQDDLSQFARWYHTAGTPEISFASEYDIEKDLYFLHIGQSHVADHEIKPLLVPIKVAFLHPSTGKMLKIHNYYTNSKRITDFTKNDSTEHVVNDSQCVLRLISNCQTFVFQGFHAQIGEVAKPILSALRGFSAPVKAKFVEESQKDASFLLKHDNDEVNRFNAGQSMTRSLILSLYEKTVELFRSTRGQFAEYQFGDAICNSVALDKIMESGDSKLSEFLKNHVAQGFQAVLNDSKLDGRSKAYLISFPALSELSVEISSCDPVILYSVYDYLTTQLAQELKNTLLQIVESDKACQKSSAAVSMDGSDERALINKAYSLLAHLKDPNIESKLLERLRNATNMTDELSSLNALNYDSPTRAVAMKEFREKWKADSLVMHKWYSVNSASNIPDNLSSVENIYRSEDFVKTNPNNIYTLLGGLKNSYVNFHRPDYQGYSYLINKVVEIDRINPAVAARLMSAFTFAKNYTKGRQSAISALMSFVTQSHGISKQVAEIAKATITALRPIS